MPIKKLPVHAARALWLFALLTGGVVASGCSQSSSQICGNGQLESGEICDDGNAVNDDTCSNVCTTPIFSPTCGDGEVQTGEACDGADLAGSTCASQGFESGALGCDADCAFDTSQCNTGAEITQCRDLPAAQSGTCDTTVPASPNGLSLIHI